MQDVERLQRIRERLESPFGNMPLSRPSLSLSLEAQTFPPITSEDRFSSRRLAELVRSVAYRLRPFSIWRHLQFAVTLTHADA